MFWEVEASVMAHNHPENLRLVPRGTSALALSHQVGHLALLPCRPVVILNQDVASAPHLVQLNLEG